MLGMSNNSMRMKEPKVIKVKREVSQEAVLKVCQTSKAARVLAGARVAAILKEALSKTFLILE
jgi:hypothetical protein